MNIGSINFRNIENTYTINKVDSKPLDKVDKDTIEISQLGMYLNKVNNDEKKIDIEKINELKRQIQNGTYKIDSKELAKKIIDKTKGEI